MIDKIFFKSLLYRQDISHIFAKKIMWKYYALLSAFFAALTAIFAKVGVKDINSNLATAIRTLVIVILTWGIVIFGHQEINIRHIERHTWAFLILSGIATGLSWLFYFKALQTGNVSRIARRTYRQVKRSHYHLPISVISKRVYKSTCNCRCSAHYSREHNSIDKIGIVKKEFGQSCQWILTC